MNTKAKGEISQAIIMTRLLQKGFSVSIPFGDNQRYDLLLDTGTELLKVQCKTAWLDRGRLRANTCSTFPNKNRKRINYIDSIDMFLIYSPDTDKVYKVNIRDAGITEIILRLDAPKRKDKNIRMAKDFEYC
jgi:hypothetical protein